MKKIEFGFANDAEPKGSWQGIGIKDGLLLTDAVYYGAISFNGNNFIVAKVDNDEYNRFPSLLDKFIVRDAVVDVYADGSNTLFLNSLICFNLFSVPVTCLSSSSVNSNSKILSLPPT